MEELIRKKFFMLKPSEVFCKVSQFDIVNIEHLDCKIDISTGSCIDKVSGRPLVPLIDAREQDRGIMLTSDTERFKDLLDSMYSHSYRGR